LECQLVCAIRTGQNIGEIKHPDACQQTSVRGHGVATNLGTSRPARYGSTGDESNREVTVANCILQRAWPIRPAFPWGVVVGEPKTQALYERLRDDLVAGAFVAGERLSENQIGQRYGVSRTPVREALGRLENEGLLARSGPVITVPMPTVEEVLDLFDVRITLEGAIARCAAERYREGDLIVLEWAAASLRALPRDATPGDRFYANRAFHRALSGAAHNQVLADLQGQLDLRVAALRATTLTAPGRWESANDQHTQIIVAVTKRDGEVAALAAEEHLRDARRLWLDLVRSGQVPSTMSR
jgi:DNA-binding GntR family transcriptional regulator